MIPQNDSDQWLVAGVGGLAVGVSTAQPFSGSRVPERKATLHLTVLTRLDALISSRSRDSRHKDRGEKQCKKEEGVQ